jgi:predicted transcriptional regulator
MNTTKELMHIGLHFISPQESLTSAYLIINDEGIRLLPVIDSKKTQIKTVNENKDKWTQWTPSYYLNKNTQR